MAADSYFSLTRLPVLDPPPAEPPLGLAELMARVPAGHPETLVRCVVLSDDLRQREATLAGELPVPEPVVLTRAQVTGESALPDELAAGPESPASRIPVDAIWSAYYRWVADRARQLGSPFLRGWVVWEVTTRNALAVARARVLGLDPEGYLVARELTDDSGQADALVASWTSATQPLDGFRGLLNARWRWVERNAPWFTFGDDEFPAYAAKLILLHRWLRASDFGPRRHAEGLEGVAP